MYIGEAFIGSGANAAHINAFVGDKNGPVGTGLTASAAAPRMGYIPFMAIHKPNVPVKPATLFAAKVDMRSDEHANLTWGPAQAGVARGVQECIDEKTLPECAANDWCIIAAVWVNPEANNADEIYNNNHIAMKTAIQRALKGDPTEEEIQEAMKNPSNPFYTPTLNK